MAFKISHIEVGSESSTPCLDKDVANDCKGSTPCLVEDMTKDCVKGGTTCLKCLDDMIKSCGRGGTTCLKYLDGMTKSYMERYVDNIEYKSQRNMRANNDVSYDIEYKSHMERCTTDVQYESKNKSLEYMMVDTTKSCIEYEGLTING